MYYYIPFSHALAFVLFQEEHEAILRGRHKLESGLAWNEYKSMRFTFQVSAKSLKLKFESAICFYTDQVSNLQFINETVRLANIVPGIFRKALRDIQFKGAYIFATHCSIFTE